MKVALVGAGVIGTSLGMLLQRAGHTLVALTSRTKRRAQVASGLLGGVEVVGDPGLVALGADLVLLAVPDREIESVAAQVVSGRALKRGAVVAHLAGGLSADVLAVARTVGAACGALHPLQTFANVETALRLLPETFFFVEGDEVAVDLLRSLVVGLGARCLPIASERKALYHAGAVAASNFVVTLVDCAVQLLVRAGVPAEEALPALLPLLKGTVQNLEQVGLPGALTGPVARGDVATVQRHLEALATGPADVLRLYRDLAYQTVAVAEAKGSVSPAQALRLRHLLREGPETSSSGTVQP